MEFFAVMNMYRERGGGGGGGKTVAKAGTRGRVFCGVIVLERGGGGGGGV